MALRSIAATSSRSLSNATATQVARPRLPPAPTTPTLICAMGADRSRDLLAGWTDRDQNRVGDKNAVDGALHGHLIHGSPPGHLLVDGTNRTSGHQLTAVARHACAGVFEAELERAGQVADCDIELLVGDPVVDQLVEFGVQQCDDLVAMFGLRTGVHLERSTVGVRRHPGVDRVRQTTTLTDLFEQATGHPSTEDLVDHVEWLAVLVAARKVATAHHDVHLLGVIVDRIVPTDLVGCRSLRNLACPAHVHECRRE